MTHNDSYRPGTQYQPKPNLTATVIKTFGNRVRLRIGDMFTDQRVNYDSNGAFLKVPGIRRRMRPTDFHPATA